MYEVESPTNAYGHLREGGRADEVPFRGATGAREAPDGQEGDPAGALGRLVERAYDSREEFVESFRTDDEWEGLSEEEIERWLSGTVASGSGVDDEEDVDEILYGRTDEFETDFAE